MTFADNKRCIIATLLLTLFLSFQGGRMLCYHTHVFGNAVISHSHPFNNSDRQHSATELESIAVIASGLLTDNSTVAPELPTPLFTDDATVVTEISNVAEGYNVSLNGRAPPYFM